jgi:hypothetical protein
MDDSLPKLSRYGSRNFQKIVDALLGGVGIWDWCVSQVEEKRARDVTCLSSRLPTQRTKPW